MSSPLKRLTRKVFERHSNPWSAWTRLASTPLVFVPFWTRSPKHALLVGGWLLLNPVVFPRPEDDSAWATKAMLGEELWIAERPLDGAMAISVVATAFGIGGVVASLKRKLAPTAICTVAEIALLLVYWRLMADYYEEHRSDRGQGRHASGGVPGSYENRRPEGRKEATARWGPRVECHVAGRW